jgi:hypothetical protein
MKARVERRFGSPRAGFPTRVAPTSPRTRRRRHHGLTDAPKVMMLMPAWFDDYNEVHPHSGLNPKRAPTPQCRTAAADCPVKRGAHHLASMLCVPAAGHSSLCVILINAASNGSSGSGELVEFSSAEWCDGMPGMTKRSQTVADRLRIGCFIPFAIGGALFLCNSRGSIFRRPNKTKPKSTSPT